MLKRLVLVALPILVGSLANAQNTTPDALWGGTWNLNVAASKLHQPAVKSETSRVETPTTTTRTVKYTLSGVGADGKPLNVTFDGVADGKPYPVMSNGQQAATVVWHRQSSTRYSAEETFPDGTKNSVTFVMAPSGKQFTGQSHVTGPSGTYDETTVWDKQ